MGSAEISIDEEANKHILKAAQASKAVTTGVWHQSKSNGPGIHLSTRYALVNRSHAVTEE